MKNDAKSLRAERLRRLSASTPKAPVVASPKVVAKPVTTPAPARAATAPVVAPTPAPAAVVVPAEPETLTVTLTDPSTLSRAASYEMSLYGKGAKNPHWLVIADGHPVAEIQYEDQDQSQVPRDLFENDQYGHAVVVALGEEEPAKILSSMKARVYAASVTKSQAYAAVRTEVAAAADADVRVARAELRDNLMNVIGLVLKAQTKNILGNDLKAELFDRLVNTGVDERSATFAIENAWKTAAVPFFESCFRQASEWMDLPPEAFVAIEKQIDSMVSREIAPIETSASSSDIPSARHNVLVETRTASVVQAQATPDFGSVFGFGR